MNQPDQQDALDAVDEFLKIGVQLAKSPMLLEPRFKPAAEDLYEIARRLLAANENMAKWLNRFLYFDFDHPRARRRFLKLRRKYEDKKAAPGGFGEMKWPCSDIEYIYEQRLKAGFDDLLPGGTRASEARKSLEVLGHADAAMVAFIADTVIADIEAFVQGVEPYVTRGDLGGADQLRLAFKVSSAVLSERLQRYANGLSNLVLQFARAAGRPMTLDHI
jgi:hypothetical protein